MRQRGRTHSSAQDTDVCADPSYCSAHSGLKTLKPEGLGSVGFGLITNSVSVQLF